MEQTIRTCDIHGCQNEEASHFLNFNVIHNNMEPGKKYITKRDIDLCLDCLNAIVKSGKYVEEKVVVIRGRKETIYERKD